MHSTGWSPPVKVKRREGGACSSNPWYLVASAFSGSVGAGDPISG